LNSEHFEVIRMVLQAGKQVPEHQTNHGNLHVRGYKEEGTTPSQ